MAKKNNNRKGNSKKKKGGHRSSNNSAPQSKDKSQDKTQNNPQDESQDKSPPLKEDTSRIPCKFFAQGRCKRGDQCNYLHSVELPPEGVCIPAKKSDQSEEEQETKPAAVETSDVKEAKAGTESLVEETSEEKAAEQTDQTIVEGGNGAAVVAKEAENSDEKPVAETESGSEEDAQPPEEDVQPPEEDAPPPEEESSIPPGLKDSLSLFSQSQQDLAKRLCELPESKNQCHLFESWSNDPAMSEKKMALMAKLESVDESYPAGGLLGYLENAVNLLDKSRRGVNPLEGWIPSVPKGETFEVGTDAYLSTEKLGLKEVGKCGFVLVAGGLGERLGYSGIKIGLPTELATETSYIQFYIETILGYQSRYAEPGQKLPLCIMTSGDTNDKTVSLLGANNYFGMDKDQITIVQQGKGVPALCDNDAHIALDPNDPYDIQMKPHGHGDIHALLHSHGVAKSWLGKGIKWTVFFQDTNGLAFHTLPLSLGVSSKMGLIMNSIACPRKAKQAIGGIAKLTKGDQQRTINVEYNQLDPLLRATGYPDGDVNDESGFSPFPGNINQLLFQLDAYADVLERTKGVMPEFVNPKYKDAGKTIFKKPTRLECMMQDFPTVLEGSEVDKVGFTSLASELCFSPVKNATADGVTLQKNGTHPGVAATGEADQNSATRQILRSIGCDIEEGSVAKFSGIEVVSGPDCVIKPSIAACANEFTEIFPNPSSVKISGRSSLVVGGQGLVIESLDLDGALLIECEEGASGVIRNLTVKNKGWVKVPDESSDNEVIRMRGYHLDKLETETIIFKKDGTIEGNYSPNPDPIESEDPSTSANDAEKASTTTEGDITKEEAESPASADEPKAEEPAAEEEKSSNTAPVVESAQREMSITATDDEILRATSLQIDISDMDEELLADVANIENSKAEETTQNKDKSLTVDAPQASTPKENTRTTKEEPLAELSQPASSESKEGNTPCCACVIL